MKGQRRRSGQKSKGGDAATLRYVVVLARPFQIRCIFGMNRRPQRIVQSRRGFLVAITREATFGSSRYPIETFPPLATMTNVVQDDGSNNGLFFYFGPTLVPDHGRNFFVSLLTLRFWLTRGMVAVNT
jgi:hypothetical protein